MRALAAYRSIEAFDPDHVIVAIGAHRGKHHQLKERKVEMSLIASNLKSY